VAYLSKALMVTERNYDIWDQEFLVIIAAFCHWRHLLVGTMQPVQVLTDHANLQYYRHPQKINQQVARYINFMEDFHYQLKHIPGVHNCTDALSQRPDHNDGSDNNKQVVAFPENVFVRTISMVTLDKELRKQQSNEHCLISEWKDKYHLCQKEDTIWYQGDALVIVGGVKDH
jgi:hypothetical protein